MVVAGRDAELIHLNATAEAEFELGPQAAAAVAKLFFTPKEWKKETDETNPLESFGGIRIVADSRLPQGVGVLQS